MKIRGQAQSPASSTPGRTDLASTSPQDVFQPSAPEHSACVIRGEESLTTDEKEFVRSTVNQAVEFYGKHFGEVKRPVVLNVLDTKRALRTGYNIKDDTINFPPNEKGRRPALASKDIIVHEAFHALVAQTYPHLVSDKFTQEKEFVRLHESLADYFAHQLYPDKHFAEGLGEDGKPLRSFSNQRRISLSPGGHSQGNAITSYLLRHKVTPVQIRTFLESGDFSLDALGQVSPDLHKAFQHDAKFSLKDEVSNYPSSSVNKYWLNPNKPLKVHFEANDDLREAHPGLTVEWLRPSGIPSATFQFKQVAQNRFTVEASKPGAEKVLAIFRDNDEVIGSRPFYFGFKGDDNVKREP